MPSPIGLNDCDENLIESLILLISCNEKQGIPEPSIMGEIKSCKKSINLADKNDDAVKAPPSINNE